VHDWLRDDRKKWVRILDNVDNAGFLIKDQSTGQDGQTNGNGGGKVRPLRKYLPRSLNGSILITTRSKSAALTLVGEKSVITVEPMSKVDALELFTKKLGEHNGGDDATELATALEFTPLAIVQAAIYISQRTPRYSVPEYLQDFRRSNRKRTNLLNHGDHKGELLRRDCEAKNSILITWQISFDYIQEIRPSATDLLSLMSFFDRQGIPEALLHNQDEQRNLQTRRKRAIVVIMLILKLAIVMKMKTAYHSRVFVMDLKTISWPYETTPSSSVNTDGITFEMHGLVQLAT
jgi:hypothetical protein